MCKDGVIKPAGETGIKAWLPRNYTDALLFEVVYSKANRNIKDKLRLDKPYANKETFLWRVCYLARMSRVSKNSDNLAMVKALFKAFTQQGLDTLLAYDHKEHWIGIFLLATFTAVWCEKCLKVVPTVEAKEHSADCYARAIKSVGRNNWQGTTLGVNHDITCDFCGEEGNVKNTTRDKWSK